MDDLRCSFCGIKVAQGKSKCPVCGTKIATLGSLNLDKASSVINGIGEKARTTNIKEIGDRFKGRLSNQNNTPLSQSYNDTDFIDIMDIDDKSNMYDINFSGQGFRKNALRYIGLAVASIIIFIIVIF